MDEETTTPTVSPVIAMYCFFTLYGFVMGVAFMAGLSYWGVL